MKRLIDADALMPLFVQKAFTIQDRHGVKIGEHWLLDYDDIKEVIDNVPTVEYPFYQEAYQTGYEEGKNERPQGEWVRKEDIINYIATQYSKHNELVPIWLSIGNLKGGADIRKGDLL